MESEYFDKCKKYVKLPLAKPLIRSLSTFTFKSVVLDPLSKMIRRGQEPYQPHPV